MNITGACHCGNIRFALDWSPDPKEITARACDCSFCQKHGGVWTSCPTGALKVTVREPEHVSKYAFGTKTAVFHICNACGVVPVVTSGVEGNFYAVVSVNAFENVDAAMLKRAGASFDGESEADRLARRARNWIPKVEFAQA